MLAPPDDLTMTVLLPVLERHWGIAVAAAEYLPVGWGSHHWKVTDTAGYRWFVTADELVYKRLSAGEPLAEGFRRLRAALAAATALRDSGAGFVVAPVPTRAGAPVTRAGDRFAAAVYPFLTGQSFAWDEFPAAHRRAVLDLVVRTHSAPAAVARTALADDFAVPYRAELEYACGPAGGDPASRDPASGNPASGVAAGAASSDVTACGPYTRPAAELIRREGPLIRRLLARYDDLARPLRRQLSGAVLTHGEPHPGNTMLTADGWVLIDWDTALLAPPERDLWDLDPGDGTILAAYAQATGITPRPAILDLYRLRWDLTDLALDVSRFRRPHTGTPDDQQSWDLLQALVARLAAAAGQAS